jgi:hypothetical protein
MARGGVMRKGIEMIPGQLGLVVASSVGLRRVKLWYKPGI